MIRVSKCPNPGCGMQFPYHVKGRKVERVKVDEVPIPKTGKPFEKKTVFCPKCNYAQLVLVYA